MKRLIASLLAVFGIGILFACGGGNSSTSVPTSPTVSPRVAALQYGYFIDHDDQLRETADHITFTMTTDEGDWTLPDYDAFRIGVIIAQLQEAKARGVNQAWVSVGFLTMTQHPGCNKVCIAPRPDGIPRLLAFRAQLDALGLTDMVRVLYPVDEPELYGLTDAVLQPAVRAIKLAWPEAKLGVIYGPGGNYPGITAYDLIGLDDYGRGAGVLDELPMITPPQQRIIIPGGANPWRNDPQPFYTFAQQHNDVYAIVAFVWFDQPVSSMSGPGIRTNGMAPAYKAIGAAIKANAGA